jgi:hypothetical protein
MTLAIAIRDAEGVEHTSPGLRRSVALPWVTRPRFPRTLKGCNQLRPHPLCPGGAPDNSPALQRWVHAPQSKPSPEGTAEIEWR